MATRQLEIRLSNLKDPVNPFVNGLSLSGNFVSALPSWSSTQLVFASVLPESFGLVLGCLHAWDHQRNVVVGFALEVLPFLWDMMTDLDAIQTSDR